MSPLERGRILLQSIVDATKTSTVKVPNNRYAQIGGQVVDCESLIVAVAGANTAEGFPTMPGCNVPQVANYIITIARDCAVTFEDNGATNVAELERVSAVSDADGQFLWEWAEALEPYVIKTYSLSYINLGGLSVTTLSLTIGVG